MRLWIALILCFFFALPGAAHEAAGLPQEQIWTFDLRVTLPLAVSMGLYLSGLVKVWSRAGPGRGIRHWQARCFTAGWSCLVFALVAPVHWLGGQLFLAHMIEHELLMVVAAPLLVCSRPWGAFMWGLPRSWRAPINTAVQERQVASVLRAISDPKVATALHAIAIWGWHIPKFFDVALEIPWIHWLQHVSFLVTALLFWWSLLRANSHTGAYGAAAFFLFVTALHSGLLGVLITLARRPLYPGQMTAEGWGLTPLQDQQAAGLAMWIPPGLIYAGAALAMLALWIRHSSTVRRAV